MYEKINRTICFPDFRRNADMFCTDAGDNRYGY